MLSVAYFLSSKRVSHLGVSAHRTAQASRTPTGSLKCSGSKSPQAATPVTVYCVFIPTLSTCKLLTHSCSGPVKPPPPETAAEAWLPNSVSSRQRAAVASGHRAGLRPSPPLPHTQWDHCLAAISLCTLWWRISAPGAEGLM